MTEYGGRAMCPADEYDDLEIREEMAWHALEEALTEADLLEHLRWVDSFAVAASLVPAIPEVGETRGGFTLVGCPLTFTAASDEHLLDGGGNGTVDLVCTLTDA